MKIYQYDVLDTTYHLQVEPDGSTKVEIRYKVKLRDGDKLRYFSEYLDFESKEMKKAAARWWADHSPDPLPTTNQFAIDIANYHGVDSAKQLEVTYSGTHYSIIGTTINEKALTLTETW